jgi:multiple sugar transport system substrate-binding protein
MNDVSGQQADRAGLTRRSLCRRLAGGAAAGVGGTVAAACAAGGGAAGQGPAASKAPVTLGVFLSISGDYISNLQPQIVAPYQAAHPNVTVEYVPYGSGNTAEAVDKLLTLMAGGTPPNIWDGPRTADWMVGQNLLAEIDPLVKRDKWDLKRYNQKQLAFYAAYQGKTWMLPYGYGGNALVVLMNTNLCQQAGVTIPGPSSKNSWTWDQWLDTLQRLTKSTGNQVTQFGVSNSGSDYLSWPLLWQGDWVSADLKSITCDSAAMQACFTKFFELPLKYHVMPQKGEATALFGNVEPFVQGKAGMAIMAPRSWPTYMGTKTVELTMAPMPRVQTSTPDMNMMMLGIIKGSKDLEESWQLMKYLVDGSRFGLYVGRIPTELDKIDGYVKDQVKNYTDPRPEVVSSAIEVAVPQLNLGRHPQTQDLTAAITNAMNDMWAGKVQPGPALTALKPQLEAIANKG